MKIIVLYVLKIIIKLVILSECNLFYCLWVNITHVLTNYIMDVFYVLDIVTQNTLESIWKEQVVLSVINSQLNKTMQLLDMGTQLTLESIWKEQVALSIIVYYLRKYYLKKSYK